MGGRHPISLEVNGQTHLLEVDGTETLALLLRERLQLTGTKIGCDSGACGACAVLVDGVLRNSCLVLAATCAGAKVITIEGLAGETELHPLQKSFVEHGAIQCGFCTPGMVMASLALLTENPQASESEIKEAISGNICRCTGYTKILKAIKNVVHDIKLKAEEAR